MAKKVKKPVVKLPKADDLEVLHPNHTLIIKGKTITVREYGFTEGLRIRVLAKPFADAIYQRLQQKGYYIYESVLDDIVAHFDVVAQLVIQSADIDMPFFESLTPDDGENLLMHWWAANHPFFQRLARNRTMVEQVELAELQKLNAQLNGVTSTKV